MGRVQRRILLTVLLLTVFAYMADQLFRKQQLKLSYFSFALERATTSLLVPDVDRLIKKCRQLSELELPPMPAALAQGIDRLLRQEHFSFNQAFAPSCFVSYDAHDFSVVIRASLSPDELVAVVREQFDVNAVLGGKGMVVGNTDGHVRRFGNYLVFSSGAIRPLENTVSPSHGNADYVVFGADRPEGVQHIITADHHFKLRNERSQKAVKGKPVNPLDYFTIAPGLFDELVFYGSRRMREDVDVFFDRADPAELEWLEDGLLYCRKDSLELVIARQGGVQDIGLLLEEQTAEKQKGTARQTSFQIGKFAVLPFETHFDWTTAVPPLSSRLSYFATYGDFTVLTNSIPAAEWYFSAVQLDGLLLSTPLYQQWYEKVLPDEVHRFHLRRSPNHFEGEVCVYQEKERQLVATFSTQLPQKQALKTNPVVDVSVDIVPEEIQIVYEQNDTLMVLNNATEVSCFTVSGEQRWKLTLSSPLVESPQLVDFENDGRHECVLFQEDQTDVINHRGKSVNGFPLQLKVPSSAGLAVNYDNRFNYRLLVHEGKQVKVYNEAGNRVEGWQFEGMKSAIEGSISHLVVKGKDIIAFKDQDKVQYILNRRGERRLDPPPTVELPNETDFVLGEAPSSLYKMGYRDGQMYTHYLSEDKVDAVEIDRPVSSVKVRWGRSDGRPIMIAEAPDKMLLFDRFGYVKNELLKPTRTAVFLFPVDASYSGFIFSDSTKNELYLLNTYGKTVLPHPIEGSSVSCVDGTMLYTFTGTSIKAYAIE